MEERTWDSPRDKEVGKLDLLQSGGIGIGVVREYNFVKDIQGVCAPLATVLGAQTPAG
jgi:hypothetical protein